MGSNMKRLAFFKFLAVAFLTSYATQDLDSAKRVCWYTSGEFGGVSVQQVDADERRAGKISNEQEECFSTSDRCYAFWQEDEKTGDVVYISRGCWEASGKTACDSSSCVSVKKSDAPATNSLSNSNFCCCSGDFCNNNATFIISTELTDPVPEQDHSADTVALGRMNVTVTTILVGSGIIFLGLVVLLLRMCHVRRGTQQKPGQETVHLMESGSQQSNAFNLEDLKLEALVGQGRYGSVWKGTVGGMSVAVKVYPAHHRVYFINERDIYSFPFMSHPSFLTYYGCDERPVGDGTSEFLLFLSLAPHGALQSYLRVHTVDWPTFCKMALSIATGLAHLHTDIKKGDKFKPCMSHRDINSNNILIKEDLSCCICDLGFATQINGSKYYFNGEEQHAETKSITDVGTLRYMSPEVLEGAVNLRDCETSLKQIDVYALGLVLWEVASRCTDFYPPGVECPSYKLPFEAEIGHPTLEQMQVLVCRHKARPLFPDLWRDTNSVRTVKETIEDCWDHDAEARLTALCVEERFHDLTEYSERQKGSGYTTGISPTGRGSCLISKEANNVLSYSEDKEGDSCQSEATMDTILTITPSNPQINCKNSNQLYGTCPSVQPYQGRNPCLERNLMLTGGSDSNSEELVDRSHKHVGLPHANASLPNDYLNIQQQQQQQPTANPPRPSLPIPFLQNVSSEPTQPKMSNLNVGTQRRTAWFRLREMFKGRRNNEGLIGNESAITVSTPVDDKFHIKVALSNGRPETRIACELGTQNNRRPNTLLLCTKNDGQTGSIGKLDKLADDSKGKSAEEVSDDVPKTLRDSFGSCARLKDPTNRVKTPGDVPLEVRRVRGKANVARFSLYDDRIMSGYFENDNFTYPPKRESESEGHRSSLDDARFSQNL